MLSHYFSSLPYAPGLVLYCSLSHTHTHTQTDRHTHHSHRRTSTPTKTTTPTKTHTHTHPQKHTHTNTHTHTHKHTHTYLHTYMLHTYKHTHTPLPICLAQVPDSNRGLCICVPVVSCLWAPERWAGLGCMGYYRICATHQTNTLCCSVCDII